MQPLLVLSVPYTGTMFTLDLLPGKRGSWPGPFQDNHKYFCHIRDPYQEKARKDCLTIVPLREYSEVQITWKRHKQNLLELESLWNEMLDLRNVIRFKIDSEDRDSELKYLSKLLNTDLHTDWRLVNSTRTI